jgi:Phasin protein
MMDMTEARRDARHQRTREPPEDVLRESVEQVERFGREQRRVGERAAQTGADLLQSNVDMFQRAVESTTGFVMDMAERNAEGYTRPFGSATDKTRQATRLAGTLEDISVADITAEWLNFVPRQARRNIEHWNAMMHCRTPQDFVTTQSELFRDNLDDALQSWRRIVERSMQVGGKVGRTVTESAERVPRSA